MSRQRNPFFSVSGKLSSGENPLSSLRRNFLSYTDGEQKKTPDSDLKKYAKIYLTFKTILIIQDK